MKRSLMIGKLLNHDRGVGVVNAADLEQRASEIARIEHHGRISNEDRRQARREFNGEDIPPACDDDAEGVGGLSRDPSEPRSIRGRQIPNFEGEDELFAAERLVAEGMNEAEHDQMLAACRRRRE